MRFRPLCLLCTVLTVAAAAEPAPPPASPPEPSADELYQAGKELFDEFAPPEVKEQYEFPSKESWDAFAQRLQQGLDQNDLSVLAQYEPEARAALAALRALPDYSDYADWLEGRLDYIEAAGQVAKQPMTKPPPSRPGVRPVRPVTNVPYYDLWLARVRSRPVPARAGQLMPLLREAFATEGVPAELAWLAEVESTLDPAARSPAGAKGLFQLMPVTARSLGLSTFLPDERTDAAKAARAAARYLRTLYGKFGEWPLAFAAYNAGEGRVRRLLESRGGHTFADVAAALPAETRMYVPKVCATVAVRAGVTPDRLPAPVGS
ncbi:MAG: lytic transglycosylase domain-containing protein [Verrucomicrobia bacterium]|nr:lytic transglycosylase domain-containing protein [Verrucomicrobiota bacterium]